MRKWIQSGVTPSPIDQEEVNGLPPRKAASLALSSAEEIDLFLEKAPDELMRAIANLGDRFRLYRSDHRKMHLDEIEAALKKGK